MLRKTNTVLYNLREMMVTMVPMEIPVNRYCDYFHVITDVEKFAFLPTNSIQSLFLLKLP